jgi:hypothetical protein
MMAKELTHASNGSPRLAILTFLTASNLVALTRIAGNENKLNLHKNPISRVADALSRNSAPSSAQGIFESYSVHPRHLLGIRVAFPDRGEAHTRPTTYLHLAVRTIAPEPYPHPVP